MCGGGGLSVHTGTGFISTVLYSAAPAKNEFMAIIIIKIERFTAKISIFKKITKLEHTGNDPPDFFLFMY